MISGGVQNASNFQLTSTLLANTDISFRPNLSSTLSEFFFYLMIKSYDKFSAGLCAMICILLCLVLFTNFIQNGAPAPGNQWYSIQEMNAFFEKHFARENQTTIEKWNQALPTDVERLEVSALILYLMTLKNFDKTNPREVLELYPTIRKYLDISLFDVSKLLKVQLAKKFAE